MSEFKAKKAFGQNFISDPQIIEAIADAGRVGPEDTVVEIGPGKGALTCTLAERAARVIAVELDAEVIPLLKGNLAGAPNVRKQTLQLKNSAAIRRPTPEQGKTPKNLAITGFSALSAICRTTLPRPYSWAYSKRTYPQRALP